MARVAERLTARAIQAAKARGLYADGKGLYLRVGPTGSKSWIYRYVSAGRQHDLGLGPFPEVSLAEARERAMAQRRLRINGNDPLAERRSQRHAETVQRIKAQTFRQSAVAYIEAHSAGWRGGKQAEQWRQSLTAYAYPMLGDLPVQAIDTSAVLAAVEPVWRTKTETATRVRERIEAVLNWATARGYRAGENPARWKGHLANLLPARSKVQRVAHHPALPYAEIADFMAELRARDGVPARALEFLILTAARSGEVLKAGWDEIDLKERIWTVPAERTKTGRQHRVPLSDEAIAALPECTGEFIFPGRGGAPSKTALFDMLRRMGRDDLTTHGFRSTFRDWAGERTAYPREVAEMALAHTVGDAVERAYARGDLFEKRRQLMQAWADYCAQPATGGEVVSIRA
jgi:integrase